MSDTQQVIAEAGNAAEQAKSQAWLLSLHCPPCPFSDWRCTTETVIIEQPIMLCLLACVAMPQPRLDCWLGLWQTHKAPLLYMAAT